jgi:hypothetical protein
MSNTKDGNEDSLVRFSSQITREAHALLKRECKRRYALEARFVPLGCVVSELVAEHFGKLDRRDAAVVHPKQRSPKNKKAA